MRIHKLDSHTINQIAAGEVIENSSSVVKELVDNALDSGAVEIVVEIENGGRTRICVEDNGSGMDEDSLKLCIQRHATSKIRTIEDLNQVKTMGFRGEALASIAAVSKMKLVSSESDGVGYLLSLVGGEVKAERPQPRKRGTTIEVCDLFFNTPVRKGFQKSPSRDVAVIHRLLSQYALVNTEVGFTLICQGEKLIEISPDFSFQERVEKVLGEPWTGKKYLIQAEEEEFSAQGYLAAMEQHKGNRLGQYFFINGRALHSPFLSQQLSYCCSTRLPMGRFPQAVVHLKLPLHWVDVNVHPQKREVRLREEERIAKFLRRALDQALSQEQVMCISELPYREKSLTFREPVVSFSSSYKEENDTFRKPPIRFSTPSKEESCGILPPIAHFEKNEPLSFSFTQPIGIVDTFLLVAEEKGIRLVALQRLYPKLLKAELKERCEKQLPPASQGLLLPISLHFMIEEIALLDSVQELCAAFGLRFSSSSGVVNVTALPPYIKERYVRNLLESLIENPQLPDQECLIHAFAKEGSKRSFSFEEGQKILKECEKRGLNWQTESDIITAEELHERFQSKST